MLVLDEADLLLSYGYSEDLQVGSTCRNTAADNKQLHGLLMALFVRPGIASWRTLQIQLQIVLG